MNAVTTSACLKSWSWVQLGGNRWRAGNTTIYLSVKCGSSSSNMATEALRRRAIRQDVSLHCGGWQEAKVE